MIPEADVPRVALAAFPTLLAKWMPGGSFSFANGYSGPSPKSTGYKRNLRELVVHNNGDWKDAGTGASGSGPISLFAYLSGKTTDEATTALAKMLDPGDELAGRAARRSR